MTNIILKIEDCSLCPFHTTSPYPTSDSFERPSYWWCNHPDVRQEEKNEAGGYAKKIAGYVKWNDDTPVPDWCPIRLPDKADAWGKEIKGVKIGRAVPSDKEYIHRIPNVPSSFFATEDDEGEVDYLNKIASKTTSKDLDYNPENDFELLEYDEDAEYLKPDKDEEGTKESDSI